MPRPCDLLMAAAARIRWQQRLLCALPSDSQLEVNATDVEGLYFAFEDIYHDIIEAARLLAAQQRAAAAKPHNVA